jgi:hypothetical protein
MRMPGEAEMHSNELGGETRSPAYNVGVGAGVTRRSHTGEPFFLFLLFPYLFFRFFVKIGVRE